jgi:hypothetical protein
MKMSKPYLTLLALLAFGTLAGCSATSTKSADVSDSIRKSLDQAGLKDVSASNDRSSGAVTLTGQVETDRDKSQAESIAKSIAGGQVMSNQIAVMGTGHKGPMGDHGPGQMAPSGAGHMGDRNGSQMAEPHR